MTEPKQDPRYQMATSILDEYNQKDTTIDMGNLAYAIGCTFAIIDDLTEERDRLRDATHWISVDEREPGEEWVLVWADGAVNCMAHIPGRGFEDWTNPTHPNVIEDLITHWLPIPGAPDDTV